MTLYHNLRFPSHLPACAHLIHPVTHIDPDKLLRSRLRNVRLKDSKKFKQCRTDRKRPKVSLVSSRWTSVLPASLSAAGVPWGASHANFSSLRLLQGFSSGTRALRYEYFSVGQRTEHGCKWTMVTTPLRNTPRSVSSMRDSGAAWFSHEKCSFMYGFWQRLDFASMYLSRNSDFIIPLCTNHQNHFNTTNRYCWVCCEDISGYIPQTLFRRPHSHFSKIIVKRRMCFRSASIRSKCSQWSTIHSGLPMFSFVSWLLM